MTIESLIESLIAKHWGKIIEIRKYLHMHPEIKYTEFETQKCIVNCLKEHGVEYADNIYETAVVALVKGKHEGKTIALRADMDALLIEEKTDADFKSLNAGVMHACGHDAHMTMMLGTLLVLNELKDSLKGNVKVLFQPAEEEGIKGGAKGLIENGALKNPDVDMILSTHVSPDLPVGTIGIRAGNNMASIDLLRIKIKGKAGHISMPHKSINPVVVANQLLTTIALIKNYYIDPFETVIWDLPSMQPSECVGNIIAGEVALAGSVRTYNNDVRDYIEKKCGDILEGFKKIYDIDYEYKYLKGYSATVNDQEAADFLRDVSAEVLGKENVLTPEPQLGAEDYGEYLRHVKGTFSFVGTREEGSEYYPTHHNKFMVPDKTIETGIKVFSNAVLKYLS